MKCLVVLGILMGLILIPDILMAQPIGGWNPAPIDNGGGILILAGFIYFLRKYIKEYKRKNET